MSQFIALLRGVNVGGNRKLPMADLRAMAGELGLEAPKTLLQSGNLVFGAEGKAAPALEGLLEKATKKRFGAPIPYVVRSAQAWARILASNPLPKAAQERPQHLLVIPLKGPIAAKNLETLRSKIPGREVVEAVGECLYIDFRDGIGTSTLANQLTERVLGTVGTARNWNTATKLLGLAGG